MSEDQTINAGAVARGVPGGKFRTHVDFGGIRITADEPVEAGGDATGPAPYDFLSAAMASCTSMTLRLYAERKGWDLPPFAVRVSHELVPAAPGERPLDRFNRSIDFDAPIPSEQQAKLLEIADKCPVHRTLIRGSEIRTDLSLPE